MTTEQDEDVEPAVRRRNRPGPAATSRSNARDVARLAGVSPATVSRVLADSSHVLPATREKVLSAMAELDYVANGHALALTGRIPGGIALVTRTIATATFADAAAGVDEVISPQGRTFALYTSHSDPAIESAIVERLREQRFMAAIWLGAAIGHLPDERFVEYATRLATVGTRLVLAGRPRMSLPPSIPVIDYAHADGVDAAVTHLIGLGHRRILFAGLDVNHSSSTARLAGYRRALARAGIAVDDDLVQPTAFTLEGGAVAVERALRQGTPFTAVAAAADFVAVGAVRTLTAHRLSIPADVSVVGFDDMPFSGDLRAPLTTVRVDFVELGRRSAALALGLTDTTDEVMPVSLIVRSSTGPA